MPWVGCMPACYQPQAVGEVEAGRAKIDIRLMKNLDTTTCRCQSMQMMAMRKLCRIPTCNT